MNRRLYLPSLLSVAVSSVLLAAPVWSDWPEFRGPTQNGVLQAVDLPLEWDEEKNVRWFAQTNGLGWSSPVISGNKIYITTAIQDVSAKSPDPLAGAQKLVLECYNAENGARLFSKTIFEQPEDAPSIHKKNSHASPTPIVDGDRLYLHFGHQGTACTDLDGNIIWTNRDHVYPPTHGNGGSPILVRDKLILTCDGGDKPYTLALDKMTGKEIWKTPRDIACDKPFSFCTPQLINVDGVEQIVSPGSNIVQSLDPKTGKVLWYVTYEGFSVIPRPVYHQGLVYISTGYMTPTILAIDPTGSGNVTQTHLRWSCRGGAPNTPSFVPFQDQILTVSDSGIAASVDAKTGKENWKKRIGGNYSASLMLLGDKLLMQSETGEAIVYRVGEALEELHRNQLPGRIFATYAVIGKDWIIRTEKGLYRIGQ
ncbi:MAG: PQQ-binding-like beta-propeller repeat protein [Pirellula sp.]|nr:PQQ-binding-like beta-propeller repeat protein [Pirellula sp.]